MGSVAIPHLRNGQDARNSRRIPQHEKRRTVADPELVAQIESAAMERARTEAAAAERKRIQDIESIEAQIADKSLIDAAKYGEKPCDAAQLALMAMRRNAQLGQTFLNGLEKDAEASGTQTVVSVPNGGNPDEGESETAKLMANAFAAYKAMKGGK